MAKLIAKTYGNALFELGEESNKLDIFFEEVGLIKRVLLENKDFGLLMTHPNIDRDERLKILENVFKSKVSDEILCFLRLALIKGRYLELDAIFDVFIAKVKENKGIGVVYVDIPFELSASQKKALEEKILSTTKYSKLEMNYAINVSLLGGIKIRIGDRVLDSSVAIKLEELQWQLLKIQLKYES